MDKLGKLIRFPVERRRGEVVGTGTGGSVEVTLGVGVTMTSMSTSGLAPAWWAKVPAVTDRANDRSMWMKLGPSPGVRAKRHRVIALRPDGDVLYAQAACGRRAVLGVLFNDAWSSGDCALCHARGWR